MKKSTLALICVSFVISITQTTAFASSRKENTFVIRNNANQNSNKAIFQNDVDGFLRLFACHFIGCDVAFVLQNRGNAFAQFGVLGLAGFFSGLAGVADNGEKVSDAIVSSHNNVPFALPGGFGDTGKLAIEGEFAEGDA